MRRIFSALLLALFLLTGCTGEKAGSAPQTAEIYAMDTVMDFSVYGSSAEEAIDASIEEIYRIEDLLSCTIEDSLISSINESNGQAVEITDEVKELLQDAMWLSRATDGAFDITVAPIVSAWGFRDKNYRIPSAEEILDLLKYVGSDRIQLSGNEIELEPGMSIDLGGIAKGYAADQVADILRSYGVDSTIISLGGNVYAKGTKPDGSSWRVAVRDPANAEDYVGTLLLENAYAVTSGGYQRYFEQDGQVYHHIIDPSTGYPADSGLTSVTVISDSGTACDALSTALFVLGEEGAIELWQNPDWDRVFDMVLVTDDGRVIITPGLADRFEPKEGSSYTYETLS